MAKCLEILGIVFGVIGLIAAIVTCVLPIWKVTAFIGANIITAQIIWEGLWMNCITQSTGQMQCKIYDSMLALPQDLQAARAMTVISIVLGILGVLISIVGAKCMKWGAARAKVMIISGIFFILAGILVLIPVCWVAHTIIRDFYNPLLIYAQRREIGVSLYIGWASAALFLIGGVLLCSRCPPKEKYKPLQMVYTKTDGGHNNRDNV
ncbi:claudin-3 [Austrofundulus limnaeus]|uniref:Claudin n=1 Tax=Austrofundulus limnaeus TaxID=52670 RepID=A0A2I4BX84_AUSLI|nr:PREDICTED: claudin-3-like [Austrofundulus limnaeus]